MQAILLEKLLEALVVKSVEGDLQGEVSGLVHDSRKVKPGTLFFSISGRRTQGWLYAREAIAHGARAVVVDRNCPIKGVPLVRVPDVRLALALLADRFYGSPSRSFKLIGVTGTNGKTTTAHMIDALFRGSGEVTGLLGTVGCRIGDHCMPSPATTPEADELQAMFSRLASIGATHVTMEVSSHALELKRVDGCHFNIAVLTNITSEHLDFHHTFEAYRNAKTRLFSQMGWGEDRDSKQPMAILNADDPCFEYVSRRSAGQIVTYGIHNPADVRASGVRQDEQGIFFQVESFAGIEGLKIPLKGRFNVYNALAAIASGLAEGLPLPDICTCLTHFSGVPGRFELVEAGQDFYVVVDYAHTPDGLENVIKTARDLSAGRIITVFGCGGERDRSKRSLMGEVAGRLSDLAIVTDDNPRGEESQQIMREVITGLQICRPREGYRIIADRKQAIRIALDEAGSGDLVLIAGKGHETEQIYHDRIIPFNDRQVAQEMIMTKLKRKLISRHAN